MSKAKQYKNGGQIANYFRVPKRIQNMFSYTKNSYIIFESACYRNIKQVEDIILMNKENTLRIRFAKK